VCILSGGFGEVSRWRAAGLSGQPSQQASRARQAANSEPDV